MSEEAITSSMEITSGTFSEGGTASLLGEWLQLACFALSALFGWWMCARALAQLFPKQESQKVQKQFEGSRDFRRDVVKFARQVSVKAAAKHFGLTRADVLLHMKQAERHEAVDKEGDEVIFQQDPKENSEVPAPIEKPEAEEVQEEDEDDEKQVQEEPEKKRKSKKKAKKPQAEPPTQSSTVCKIRLSPAQTHMTAPSMDAEAASRELLESYRSAFAAGPRKCIAVTPVTQHRSESEASPTRVKSEPLHKPGAKTSPSNKEIMAASKATLLPPPNYQAPQPPPLSAPVRPAEQSSTPKIAAEKTQRSAAPNFKPTQAKQSEAEGRQRPPTPPPAQPPVQAGVQAPAEVKAGGPENKTSAASQVVTTAKAPAKAETKKSDSKRRKKDTKQGKENRGKATNEPIPRAEKADPMTQQQAKPAADDTSKAKPTVDSAPPKPRGISWAEALGQGMSAAERLRSSVTPMNKPAPPVQQEVPEPSETRKAPGWTWVTEDELPQTTTDFDMEELPDKGPGWSWSTEEIEEIALPQQGPGWSWDLGGDTGMEEAPRKAPGWTWDTSDGYEPRAGNGSNQMRAHLGIVVNWGTRGFGFIGDEMGARYYVKQEAVRGGTRLCIGHLVWFRLASEDTAKHRRGPRVIEAFDIDHGAFQAVKEALCQGIPWRRIRCEIDGDVTILGETEAGVPPVSEKGWECTFGEDPDIVMEPIGQCMDYVRFTAPPPMMMSEGGDDFWGSTSWAEQEAGFGMPHPAAHQYMNCADLDLEAYCDDDDESDYDA